MEEGSRRVVYGCAIDKQGTRVFDDAVWLERVPTGGTHLLVSVPDLSESLPRGSELDRAMREFRDDPDSSLQESFLWRFFSGRRLGLLPGGQRKAITLALHVDENFRATFIKLEQTKLWVKDTLSFEQADRIAARPERHPLGGLFGELHSIACGLFKKRRISSGRFAWSFPQGYFLDQKGVAGKLELSRPDSWFFVRECMILANKLVAEFLLSQSMPTLFRYHEGEERVSLGYTTSRRPHESLGFDLYTHFTSPVRRYADLVVQRIVCAVIAGESSPYGEDELERLAEELTRKQKLSRRKNYSLGGVRLS